MVPLLCQSSKFKKLPGVGFLVSVILHRLNYCSEELINHLPVIVGIHCYSVDVFDSGSWLVWLYNCTLVHLYNCTSWLVWLYSVVAGCAAGCIVAEHIRYSPRRGRRVFAAKGALPRWMLAALALQPRRRGNFFWFEADRRTQPTESQIHLQTPAFSSLCRILVFSTQTHTHAHAFR